MKYLIIFLSLSFISQAKSQNCPQLSGYWFGDCLYQSKLHGNLKGSYDVELKQDSCSEIKINETTVSIPGEHKDEVRDGDVVITSIVKLWWDKENENRLNFYNELTAFDDDGYQLDDVRLTGSFVKTGDRKMFLKQSGIIDTDEVLISCELSR